MSIQLKQGQSVSLGRVAMATGATIGRPANLGRTIARATGQVTYIGAPCRHGHAGERYASTRACVECMRSSGRRSMEGPFLQTGGAAERVFRAPAQLIRP
jgi:hypothetical protein